MANALACSDDIATVGRCVEVASMVCSELRNTVFSSGELLFERDLC